MVSGSTVMIYWLQGNNVLNSINDNVLHNLLRRALHRGVSADNIDRDGLLLWTARGNYGLLEGSILAFD